MDETNDTMTHLPFFNLFLFFVNIATNGFIFLNLFIWLDILFVMEIPKNTIVSLDELIPLCEKHLL
jgi:hypothetical protein